MTQEATTYTCSRCTLPCDVAIAAPLSNRTALAALSLCCNAPANEKPIRLQRSSPRDTTLHECATPSCKNGTTELYCRDCVNKHRTAAGFEALP